MSRRVLFVHNSPTRFVQIDLALLRERYDITEWYQRGRVVNIPSLANAVRQSDLVFGWFASWHTFWPMLIAGALGRPALLVIGGYDTANLPEIGYGHMRGGLKRWIACRTISLASELMTNSCYARDEAIRNAGVDGSRVTVAHHGLEDDAHADGHPKQALALTVANVDRSNVSRKGLDAFTRAAALLPAVQFVVIGAWRDDAIDDLRSIASPNVQFAGWLDRAAMNEYYARAKVYVQASRHEAFGLAVAEAMLHGCVPVVTRAGGLPELVGESGIYIEAPLAPAVADGIRSALAAPERLGALARERIQRQFTLERRRQHLFELAERTLAVARDPQA